MQTAVQHLLTGGVGRETAHSQDRHDLVTLDENHYQRVTEDNDRT